ncbi:hypothetical protein [Mycobacterium angelicum]|uniref:hypothetical protein n=1 Tax=Mycobacterium angelicum TaxID=470074 RepID=UPI0014763480|nr:hypothetical protein [Mycobacterium angelicum]MCV7200272.1 hypothetical protein [Mycobacterium angelicum]
MKPELIAANTIIEAMDRYMSDPRRIALAADREQAIARTEIVPVQIVSDRDENRVVYW